MSLNIEILTLLKLAGRPVRVIEVATAFALEPSEVVEIVDGLVTEGLVADTGGGIRLAEGYEPFASPSHEEVVAGQWARALVFMDEDPVEAGFAFLRAGDHVKACEQLLPAALDDHRLEAVEALLSDHVVSHLSSRDRGRLYLARAAHREGEGNSLGAAGDIAIATRHLDGAELVDALGYGASVADDQQRPQQSETLAALAVAAASRINEPAKQGSLLTLLGKQLSRIGFTAEADRTLSLGTDLVEKHGTTAQRDWANWNKGWVHLDRGEVREAESVFGLLRDHAVGGDELDLAMRDAYWARSLFGIGHAAEAIEAAERAKETSRRLGADAPEFIAVLALMEGALWFERFDEAALHAGEALSVVHSAGLAWENVTLVGKARAQIGLGDPDAARETILAALAATPQGPDGWRLRLQARRVHMGLIPSLQKWPQRDAEDLTDELLRAQWFSTATQLMVDRAKREGDRELALEAAGLAYQLGNPMLASQAIDAGQAWDDQTSFPVARAVQSIETHVPDIWKDEWRAIPAVAAALTVETTEEVDRSVLQRHIDDAMKAAGLAGADVVLSPAQRAAGGLVRRRVGRERRILRRAGSAAAVVALSIGSLFLFNWFTDRPVELSLEETLVERPADGVFGTSAYRGGPTRTGITEGSIEVATGYYWREVPGGLFGAPPVAFGNVLFIASSTSDQVHYLSQDRGRINFTIRTGGRVRSAPGFDPDDARHLVFGADDAKVYGANVKNLESPWNQPAEVDGRVSASPLVIGDTAVVVTENGVVRALSILDTDQAGGFGPGTGEEVDTGPVWTYTGSRVVPLGNVDTSPAFDGSNIIVVDTDGFLHIIDLATGEAACPLPIQLTGALARGSNPIISAGLVYLPAGAWLDRVEIGECFLMQPLPAVDTDLFSYPPVIDEGVVYAVQGPRVRKLDASPGAVSLEDLWAAPFVTEGLDPISTAPTLAGDVVYFGTQGGIVYAISAQDGSELWRFDIGARVEGLAPVRNAVFATNADGEVIAIAGE